VLLLGPIVLVLQACTHLGVTAMAIPLGPASLLNLQSPEIGEVELRAFLSKLESAAAAADQPYTNARSMSVATDDDKRWMAVRYKLQRESASKEWVVEGQLLSDDRLGKLNALLFLPRSVTNTQVFAGGAVSEADATRSWNDARVDLEAISLRTALQMGIGP
jgi:hypothetical protein